MESNPYKSPESKVEDVESTKLRPVRGILGGLVVDIGGTIIGAIILTIVYQMILVSQGTSKEQIEQLLLAVTPFSLFGLINLAWGLSMSFAGGYYCIKASNGRDYSYPMILGALGFVLSMLMVSDQMDRLVALILSAVAFSMTIYGARTALIKRNWATAQNQPD